MQSIQINQGSTLTEFHQTIRHPVSQGNITASCSISTSLFTLRTLPPAAKYLATPGTPDVIDLWLGPQMSPEGMKLAKRVRILVKMVIGIRH